MWQPRTQVPHIGIVGAGFAGLRCAAVLTRYGAKVTILEARDRVGGRCMQRQLNNHLIDLGPNWIHGMKGNPIAVLAEKTGTVVIEPEERSIVIDKLGQRRSPAESGALSEEFWAMVVNAFKYSNETEDIDVNRDLASHIKEHWTKNGCPQQLRLDDLMNEARLWGQFVGGTLDRQSLKFFFLEQCVDDENVFVASTYKDVLKVVEEAAIGAEVQLNHEVKKVRYRSGAGQGPVSVDLHDGTQRQFDELVVTCPLGWLKRNKDHTFQPSLPQRLSKAIDSIGYGALEKLYITFPTAFWISDHEQQDPESQDIFVNFHHPEYHPDPRSKESNEWNQSVVSLAHLPGRLSQPTLLFYMYGACGRYLVDKVKDHDPSSREYAAIVEEFALPFYSKLMNFDVSSPSCKPVASYMTTWGADEFSGYGSYSNFQIGLEEGDKDIEVMRAAGGLSEEGKGLWLAGEHTSPFIALGTTTGAYMSGEAVAEKIARRYGLKDTS